MVDPPSCGRSHEYGGGEKDCRARIWHLRLQPRRSAFQQIRIIEAVYKYRIWPFLIFANNLVGLAPMLKLALPREAGHKQTADRSAKSSHCIDLTLRTFRCFRLKGRLRVAFRPWIGDGGILWILPVVSVHISTMAVFSNRPPQASTTSSPVAFET